MAQVCMDLKDVEVVLRVTYRGYDYKHGEEVREVVVSLEDLAKAIVGAIEARAFGREDSISLRVEDHHSWEFDFVSIPSGIEVERGEQ